MDYSTELQTHIAKKEKHWVPLHATLGETYADYVLASIARLYTQTDVRVSHSDYLERIKVNAVDKAIIPTGYGANSAIYLAFNPDITQVDAVSGSSDDFRASWKYGHNSAYYVHTDDKGRVIAVTTPEGHKPNSFILTSGALDLLQEYNGSDIIPLPDHIAVPDFYLSTVNVDQDFIY